MHKYKQATRIVMGAIIPNWLMKRNGVTQVGSSFHVATEYGFKISDRGDWIILLPNDTYDVAKDEDFQNNWEQSDA